MLIVSIVSRVAASLKVVRGVSGRLWENRFLIDGDPDHGCWIRGGMPPSPARRSHRCQGSVASFARTNSSPFSFTKGDKKWCRYGITGCVNLQSLAMHARTKSHASTLQRYLDVTAARYDEAGATTRQATTRQAEWMRHDGNASPASGPATPAPESPGL